jgi:sulfopyruvate decarboxylase subunit alpha
MNGTASANATLVVDELTRCGVRLAAALPDDWLVPVLSALESSSEVTYVPVAREMEAVGICSGAFFGGAGSVAVMGIAGLFTCIHELATLNIAHGIPLLILASLRGGVDDQRTYQVAQGQYGLKVLDALEIPYVVIRDVAELATLGDAYAKSRVVKRPLVAFLAKSVLQPQGGRRADL